MRATVMQSSAYDEAIPVTIQLFPSDWSTHVTISQERTVFCVERSNK